MVDMMFCELITIFKIVRKKLVLTRFLGAISGTILLQDHVIARLFYLANCFLDRGLHYFIKICFMMKHVIVSLLCIKIFVYQLKQS